ncbi:hypothetical protein BU23DRAFT_631567, partial [Bimuria novae-zelandiae CBS 107.79]
LLTIPRLFLVFTCCLCLRIAASHRKPPQGGLLQGSLSGSGVSMASRPAKIVLTLFTALFAPVYLTILSLYYIPRRLRPTPDGAYAQPSQTPPSEYYTATQPPERFCLKFSKRRWVPSRSKHNTGYPRAKKRVSSRTPGTSSPSTIIFSAQEATPTGSSYPEALQGGNLVLALLRHIEATFGEGGNALPRPYGAMLWSPWVDVNSDAIGRYRKSGHLRTDFLNAEFLQWGVDAYTLAGDQARPYISPLTHPFESKTPIFVQVGTAEMLYGEVRQLVEEMKSVPGNRLALVETADASHDILRTGGIMGLKEAVADAMQQANDFLAVVGEMDSVEVVEAVAEERTLDALWETWKQREKR